MSETMTLRSLAFSDHALIPTEYAHSNGDVSPPLEWLDVPDDTAELALTCEDPDADGFVHWLLVGIPPERDGLEPGHPPASATAGLNGFGTDGYGGPHPPAGDEPHRYFFRLYALPERAGLPPGFTADDLTPFLDKALAKATLVGTFGL